MKFGDTQIKVFIQNKKKSTDKAVRWVAHYYLDHILRCLKYLTFSRRIWITAFKANAYVQLQCLLVSCLSEVSKSTRSILDDLTHIYMDKCKTTLWEKNLSFVYLRVLIYIVYGPQ